MNLASTQKFRIPIRDVIIAIIGFGEYTPYEILDIIHQRFRYFGHVRQSQIDGLVSKMTRAGIIKQVNRDKRFYCKLTHDGLVEYSVIKDRYPTLRPKYFK